MHSAYKPRNGGGNVWTPFKQAQGIYPQVGVIVSLNDASLARLRKARVNERRDIKTARSRIRALFRRARPFVTLYYAFCFVFFLSFFFFNNVLTTEGHVSRRVERSDDRNFLREKPLRNRIEVETKTSLFFNVIRKLTYQVTLIIFRSCEEPERS